MYDIWIQPNAVLENYNYPDHLNKRLSEVYWEKQSKLKDFLEEEWGENSGWEWMPKGGYIFIRPHAQLGPAERVRFGVDFDPVFHIS